VQKSFFLSAGIALFVRVMGAVASFLATFFVARFLGVDESGYYFMMIALVTILVAAGGVGLEDASVKLAGINRGLAWSYYKKVMLVASFGGGVVSLLLFFSAEIISDRFFSKPNMAAVFKAVSPGVFFQVLYTITAFCLQGLRKASESILVLMIMINVMVVLAVITGVASSASELALCYSFSSVVIFALGFVIVWRHCFNSREGEFPWPRIFNSCIPLWPVMFMTQVQIWSGQFLAGVYLDVGELSRLSIAYRLAMLTSFMLTAVNLVVGPRFSRLWEDGDKEGLVALSNKALGFIVIFSSPLILGMLLFPRVLMGFFGEEFVSGSIYLQILAVGQFFNAATGAVGYLLIMSGNERALRNITLLVGGVGFFSLWGLTAMYGALGNALGGAIVVALSNVIAVFSVNKLLGFNPVNLRFFQFARR